MGQSTPMMLYKEKPKIKEKAPRIHYNPTKNPPEPIKYQACTPAGHSTFNTALCDRRLSRAEHSTFNTVLWDRGPAHGRTPRTQNRTIHCTLDLYTVYEEHASVTSHATRMRNFECCGYEEKGLLIGKIHKARRVT